MYQVQSLFIIVYDEGMTVYGELLAVSIYWRYHSLIFVGEKPRNNSISIVVMWSSLEPWAYQIRIIIAG
jgi:hypothetical protein